MCLYRRLKFLNLTYAHSQLKYVFVVNLVMWLHILSAPCWCMSAALFGTALPEDGAYFETCWSCVNFNTPFKKIVHRLVCKNFDNIKMHGTTVKKNSMSVFEYEYRPSCVVWEFPSRNLRTSLPNAKLSTCN